MSLSLRARPWARPCLLLFSALLGLSACGGGGGESPATAPVTATPAVTPKVSVQTFSAPASGQPTAVVKSATGTQILYYGPSTAAGPTQAVLQQADGTSYVTYFNADGSVDKVTDPKTGNFTKLTVRRDKMGMDFITYAKSGAFISGYSVFTDGLKWYSANVLGDLGQITLSYAGATPGSGVLLPTTLSYDTPVALNAQVQQMMAGLLGSSTAFSNPLWKLIPSAHAATQLDVAKLITGGVLIAAGVAAGPLTLTGGALVVVGGVLAGSTLHDIWKKNTDTLIKGFDSVMADKLINDLDAGQEPTTSYANAISGVVAGGLNNIRQSAVAAVERKLETVAAVALPAARADTGVAPQALPYAVGNGLSLTGTTVNSNNTVYNMNGTLDANGNLVVNGTAPDNSKLAINGAVSPSKAISGNFRASNAAGATTSSGALSSASISEQGKCSSNTQSGGNGTFSYAFNIGKPGTFTLSYDMFSVPDALTLIGGGATLYSTGGPVSGSKTVTLTSTSATVMLNVSAPTSGTSWTATVGCAS